MSSGVRLMHRRLSHGSLRPSRLFSWLEKFVSVQRDWACSETQFGPVKTSWVRG